MSRFYGDSYRDLLRILTAARQGQVNLRGFTTVEVLKLDYLAGEYIGSRDRICTAELRMIGRPNDYEPAEVEEDDGSFEYAETQMCKWAERAQARDRKRFG